MRALLGWPFLGSIAVHAAGVAVASTVIAMAPESPAPAPVAIDVVRVEPPAAPPPPPPAPPKKVERAEKITPPRLAVRPQEIPDPTPAAPAPAPAPLDEPVRGRRNVPLGANTGTPDAGLFASAASGGSMPGLAGKTFAKGDFLVPGSGGTGGGKGEGAKVAGIPQTSTDGGGVDEFARPLGGYQTKPAYPESARRQGIEGVTTLRFEVLSDGHVGRVSVATSAGHASLDRSAMDAVKTWLFEPARRGKEAVAVWVTLPVQFRLQHE